jgi:formylglycine-generating enzyme required for sulfatase activity
MGSTDGDFDEKPVRNVTKSAFYLGKYPVSNAQYEIFVPNHSSQRGSYAPDNDHPATRVTWDAAAAYIVWIGTQEGKPDLYAMPSEAAWEKASQGGLAAPRYPWGNNLDESQKIYSSKNAMTVTSGTPNGLGFHHMTGNIFCWCWDWYDKSYYQSAPTQDPYGPATGQLRTARGGTWYIYDKSFRCADRWKTFPDTVSDHIGIRIGRRLTDVVDP